MKRYGFSIVVIFILLLVTQGCGTVSKIKKTDGLESEITRLQDRIAELENEKERQATELSGLDRAKVDLEEKLKKEIGAYKAKLEMTERGLLITFLSEIFFDSGKDAIKPEGEKTLTEVASVLNASAAQSNIAVEGHTDNEPIQHSNWKSNWELSTARALSVVHYFVDTCKVKPERLSAVGYGEYRPVASNKTAEGRKNNRRVEIVILPSLIGKVKSKK